MEHSQKAARPMSMHSGTANAPNRNAVFSQVPVFFLRRSISSSAAAAAPAIKSAKVPIRSILRYGGSKIDHAIDFPPSLCLVHTLLPQKKPGRSAAVQVIGNLAVRIGLNDE